MDPEEHDKTMGAVQCLTYISNIAFSHALAEMGYKSIPENLTAPAYLLRLSSATKMFVQDPLYMQIYYLKTLSLKKLCGLTARQ